MAALSGKPSAVVRGTRHGGEGENHGEASCRHRHAAHAGRRAAGGPGLPAGLRRSGPPSCRRRRGDRRGRPVRCITFSGSGYAGAVGQTFENAVNIDWPRIDALANYTRVINWEAGTSVETFDRQPGLAPASWKYGLGWQRRHANPEGDAADARHRRRVLVASWTATARRSRCRPKSLRCTSWTCGSTRTGSSRRPACQARIRWHSGAGNRSKRAATATS